MFLLSGWLMQRKYCYCCGATVVFYFQIFLHHRIYKTRSLYTENIFTTEKLCKLCGGGDQSQGNTGTRIPTHSHDTKFSVHRAAGPREKETNNYFSSYLTLGHKKTSRYLHIKSIVSPFARDVSQTFRIKSKNSRVLGLAKPDTKTHTDVDSDSTAVLLRRVENCVWKAFSCQILSKILNAHDNRQNKKKVSG